MGDYTSYAYEGTPTIMEKTLRVTFLHIDLLLRTMIHNTLLYILAKFVRFRVIKILIDFSATISITSLSTIIYI